MPRAIEQLQDQPQAANVPVAAQRGGEADQLKATIMTLRDTLERQNAAHAREIQTMRLEFLNEKKHLQETIVKLRELLERKHERP